MTPDEAQLLAATGADASFWEGLGTGEVRLPACPACAAWVWPAQPICPSCRHQSLDWRVVEPVGRVHAWTRTWYPFAPTRQEDLPYVVVLVELPGAGDVRLLGVYAGPSDDELAVGEPLRGIIVAPSPTTFGLPSLGWVRDPSG